MNLFDSVPCLVELWAPSDMFFGEHDRDSGDLSPDELGSVANDAVQKDLFRDSGDRSPLILSLGWLANRDTLAALSSY